MRNSLVRKFGGLTDTYQGEVYVDTQTVDIPVRPILISCYHADSLITVTKQNILAIKCVRCDPKNAAIRQRVLSVRLLLHIVCPFINKHCLPET